MNYEEYQIAVKSINDLILASDDVNIQQVWSVVSDLWINNEEYIQSIIVVN